jgi:hypothetical protein
MVARVDGCTPRPRVEERSPILNATIVGAGNMALEIARQRPLGLNVASVWKLISKRIQGSSSTKSPS